MIGFDEAGSPTEVNEPPLCRACQKAYEVKPGVCALRCRAVPEAVITSIAWYAKSPAHFEESLKDLKASYIGKRVDHWFFWTMGMYVGIENDGYMHT